MVKYRSIDAYGKQVRQEPRTGVPLEPCFVSVQDGLPVMYGEDSIPVCGVRVVHPSNPRAASLRHSVTMLYVPPHATIPIKSHETEETYVVLAGTGSFHFEGGAREVGPGDFVYLPPWCSHGVENTGRDVLVCILATAPANP